MVKCYVGSPLKALIVIASNSNIFQLSEIAELEGGMI